MRFGSQIAWLFVAGGALSSAASSSNCSLTSSDTDVLEYTWVLSNFLNSFYQTVQLNQSVASLVSNSTSSSKALENLEGIVHADNLTAEAVREVSSQAPDFKEPSCQYTFPPVSGIQSFVKWAYQFESTLSGAFIGAAGYTQSPEVAFLLARLAAEHSAHATWIGSRVNSSMFQANATSLVPAYAPSQVLLKTNETGSLGTYLGDCVSAPKNPCGVLQIGPLEANITSSSAAGSSSSSVAGSSTPLTSASATATATSS
ncbi:hypothetical protein N7509_001547 [Penicillium cosmopolitanum]|uniref:Uncharacterized protein n=1 Tax=Penicillium cosmopolitanum TaxID=1131564 RepID=A0A9W9W7A7_9EURO|nr:uncharacterized protein N7509_001547 [Penicillium cosmopolitanum]KAJ5407664.1 hypothetical protein N7509_001547 [Penicillium cosmopolitanum]